MFSWLKRAWSGDEKPGGGIGGVGTAMGRGVIRTPRKLINTAYQAPLGIYGLAEIAKESLVGTDASYEAKVDEIARRQDKYARGKGIVGEGSAGGFQSLEEGSKSFFDDGGKKVKSMVGTGAELGSYVIPAKLGFLSKGAEGLKASVAGAATGGAVGSAGNQLAETGKIDPKQLAIDTTLGAVMGGGIYGGAKLLKSGQTVAKDKSIIRPTKLNDDEVIDLQNWRDVMGTQKSMNNEEIYQRGKVAAKKAGVDYTDPDAIDNILGKHRTYSTRQAERKTREYGGSAPDPTKPTIINAMTGQEIPNPAYDPKKAIVKEYADTLKNVEDSAKGGQKIPDGQGGYIRTTEHSPFYSKYYKENKRPPSKKAYAAEAERQLKAGKADPEAQKIYEDSLNPETQSLLGTAEQATSPATVGETIEVPGTAANTVTPTAAGTGPERQFGYLQSLKDSGSITPEGKASLEAIPDTYQQKPNVQTMDEATKMVKDSPDDAIKRIQDPNQQMNEVDVAATPMLLNKLAKDGDMSTFNSVAEQATTKLRDAGREVQAASLIDGLTPEGKVMWAQSKVGKVREKNPNVVREQPKSRIIQSGTEGNIQSRTPKMVQQSVDEIINEPTPAPRAYTDKMSEELTTGQKVAKGVERAAMPTPKKKVDELVKELVTKVKEEQLPAKPKAVAKPKLQILQEVFGRGKEAAEAYPEAQSILREKFADDQNMLDILDDFFASKLDMPAANSTIDTAIKQTMAKNKIKISEIITKSYADQKSSVAEITELMTKEGFDAHSANLIAVKVVNKVNKRIAQAKVSNLEVMSRNASRKAQKTYVEKIAKLSNLGALENADYIDLARAELKLPNLTEAMSTEIHKMAQKMQELPEGHEKAQLLRDIQRVASQAVPLTTKDHVFRLLSVPRAIMASADLSFGGRQGLVYLASHPIKFAEAWPKQLKMWKEGFMDEGPRAFDDMMAQIQTHPYYDYLKRSGLAISDIEGHMASAREEQFIGTELASKIPLMGRLVKASNYAYTGMANTLRANEFFSQVDALVKGGIEPDEKILKSLAEVINTSTGRGSLGKFENAAGALSTLLFSPRLMMSRIQMFNPHYYMKASGPARKEAVRNLVGLTTFTVGILGAAKLAGFEVGDDPRSANFGKIKVGDTRIDVTGGYASYVKFGYQMMSGQMVSSTTGKESQLGKGITRNRAEVLYSFLESKENPNVSFITTMLKGKDISGNPVNTPKGVTKELLSRMYPLIAKDVSDLITHPDSLGKNPAGVIAGLGLGVTGVGVQTYGAQDLPVTEKQQQSLALMKKQGASAEEIKSAKTFYQRIKVAGAKKDDVSLKVNNALEEYLDTGDAAKLDKAKKLAEEYNKILQGTMKEWADKNTSMATNKELLKMYKSKKLNLTNTTIKSRLRTIRNSADYKLKEA